MSKIINLDENGQYVAPTDYKAKYEELVERLNNDLFNDVVAKLEEEAEEKKKQPKFNQPYDNSTKYSKNELRPTLTPMMVTSRLNRYLRVFRPMNFEDAKAIDDMEYIEAFGYYCDLISYINDYLVYMPDKQTFCAFVNITTDIYNELLSDPLHAQVFKSFEDSFVQTNFSAAQAGIVDTKTTLAKLQTKDAGHNLIKSPDNITVNNYNSIDKAAINLKLDHFNSMVKGIERKKK